MPLTVPLEFLWRQDAGMLPVKLLPARLSVWQWQATTCWCGQVRAIRKLFALPQSSQLAAAASFTCASASMCITLGTAPEGY